MRSALSLLITCCALQLIACGDEGGSADVSSEDTAALNLDSSDGDASDADTVDADTADAPVAETLPPCAGEAAAGLSREAVDAPGRDSGDYSPPGDAELDALGAALAGLLEGRLAEAEAAALDAGYALCEDAAGVVLAAPAPGSGDARVLLRRGEALPLIVEAPHVNFEVGTREEALELFAGLEARAVIMTGTHRCANAEASACSGSTGVCSAGVQQPFRVSDMAHVEGAFFHRAHEILSQGYADHLVVSLHGFSQDGVSLSNGTTAPIPGDAPVARLHAALSERLPAERITTCNDYEGATREVRLCGTTNTQGRHVNGASAPCSESSENATQRFLHLEQSRSLREGGRAAVIEAFRAALSQ